MKRLKATPEIRWQLIRLNQQEESVKLQRQMVLLGFLEGSGIDSSNCHVQVLDNGDIEVAPKEPDAA